MKWWMACVVFLILGCADNNEKEFETKEREPAERKDSVLGDAKSVDISSKKINIQVLYTSSYCGGAAPNKEVLAEKNKKRWYQNSRIRIFSDTDKSLVFITQTNGEGIASVELPLGRYSVLLDTTVDEQMAHLFDVKCKAMTERIWKKFSVSENGLNGPDSEFLWVMIDFPCDPCDPSIKMRP